MAAALLLGAVDMEKAAHVPAMFVFGDSLTDPGNNNNLVTLAKANYYPNGIDFPYAATGRYCNGGTMADHLGALLGLPLIPPFTNPGTTGSNILKGVNFASAASGILSDTGLLYGDLFTMDEQVRNYKETVQNLNLLLQNGTGEFLRRSLFFICIGANDYINNYLLPFSDKSKTHTPSAYAQLLVQEYTRQIMDLYELGARRFLIGGVPPIGCTPNQIANSGNDIGSCVNSTNWLVMRFNNEVKMMVRELNTNLRGSHFLFWDTYDIFFHIIKNSSHFGFKYTNKACCGGGRSKGQIICLPILPLQCRNRSEFVFWDPYHPTDAFNAIAVKYSFSQKFRTSFPSNTQQLIQTLKV
uniref:GDSL esterase/lipase n=1 Tax=Ananas comosus var. bracteatus TaxID=296719 RepID=A0A6V7PCQ5_ANACO|nr:unnamed protein product [Ananas comosus var. bracteatus]